jgi:hypothetical protein
MLDDFLDVTKDEKQIMHMWNSFVRKQRSGLSPMSFVLCSMTVDRSDLTLLLLVFCLYIVPHFNVQFFEQL